MKSKQQNSTKRLVEHLFRQQSGKMSSILTRIFGFQNSGLVEDIIQETFLAALKTWGMKSIPENPEAWLMLVAKNKIINELNRKKRQADKSEQLHYEKTEESLGDLFLDHEIKDSQLRVLFACCHPDLQPRTQIMLTLKVLSGFGDKEIANALLMNPSAVKKAIYRARIQLQENYDKLGIPFIPEIKDRFDTVLTILYLIFNEGYKTTDGNQVLNEELCREAIRLAFIVAELPDIDQGEVFALLALMYFSLARFPSRIDNTGDLVDIEYQDRSKWDAELIKAGIHLQKKSRSSQNLSRYHLESTIACMHCTAKTYNETNWKTIVRCYEKLLALDHSNIIRLNYAIALSHLKGEEKTSLELLKKLESESHNFRKYVVFGAIAKVNMKLKNFAIAKSYYQLSHDLCDNKAEKKYMESKLLECDTMNFTSN